MKVLSKHAWAVVCGIYLFVAVGCAQTIPTAEETSKGLAAMVSATSSVAAAKQKLFDISEESFTKLCQQAKPEERDLLSLLFFTKQTVLHGMTDGDLGSNFEGKKIVKDVSDIFGKPEVVQKLSVLENYSPEDLKNLFKAIAIAWYDVGGGLPEGASGITWAAERMMTAVQNIREVELAKRSTVIKLMVFQKDIELPNSAEAVFDWSHAPSVSIKLPSPKWTAEDVPTLERLQKSKHEYYRNAAKKVLGQINIKP